MAQTNSSERNRWLLITAILTIGLISLLGGCSCGSSSSLPPPDPITSVFPPQSTDGALITTNVVAVFRDDMNSSTINATTFTLTEAGGVQQTALVSYDAATRLATLDPDADLKPDTQYTASISSSVENTSGDMPLTNDYAWSFKVSPDMFLVSENEGGIVGNDVSSMSAADGNGRFIVFESEATNLADVVTTFNRNHIYRKDTVTGEVLLVSSNNGGQEANNNSSSPSINDDGQYVVFESTATNLLDTTVGNNIGAPQIYLKDMYAGTIIMISRNATDASNNSGGENPDISSDGRFIVFDSDSTNLVANAIFIKDIYLADTDNPYVFDQISVNTSGNQDANGASINPSVSNDGRFVTFESTAATLVVTDTNGVSDVFMRDRGDPLGTNPTTVLISQDSTGLDSAAGSSNNPDISGNGQSIVFESLATNIDGGLNGIVDIFLSDTIDPAIRINVTSSGDADDDSANPSISDDGRYVVFESLATNLDGGINGISNIFIRDTQTSDAISRLSTGSTDDSYRPAISSNGRYVSFDSPFNFTSDDNNTVLDSDVYRVYNSTFQ